MLQSFVICNLHTEKKRKENKKNKTASSNLGCEDLLGKLCNFLKACKSVLLKIN